MKVWGSGQNSSQVEPGEGLAIRFQSGVLIESVGLTAGEKEVAGVLPSWKEFPSGHLLHGCGQ